MSHSEDWKNMPCILATSKTQAKRKLEEILGPRHAPLCFCHHCDEPKCSNPDHIFLGTQSENISDCWNKGRHVKPRYLLSRDSIEFILSNPETHSYDLAKKLEVSESTIRNVRRGRHADDIPF